MKTFVREWWAAGMLGFASVVVTVLLVLGLFWIGGWTTGTDMGPLLGIVRDDIPFRTPTQTFAIWDGMVLEVFEKERDERAPTVILTDKDGTVLWCIYATCGNDLVHSLQFTDYQTFPFRQPRVRGRADRSRTI